jgi:hypothetical protein
MTESIPVRGKNVCKGPVAGETMAYSGTESHAENPGTHARQQVR